MPTFKFKAKKLSGEEIEGTRKISDSIEEQAKKEGMMTMFEDGILKAVQGATSLEDLFDIGCRTRENTV